MSSKYRIRLQDGNKYIPEVLFPNGNYIGFSKRNEDSSYANIKSIEYGGRMIVYFDTEEDAENFIMAKHSENDEYHINNRIVKEFEL